MKSNALNEKLIESLPKLSDKYYDEVSWQEGDNTGSHTVFGDVLTPYLVECILTSDTQEVTNIFNFIETLLYLNDDYANEVISLSVFESIEYLFKEKQYLVNLLGKRSKKLLTELTDLNIYLSYDVQDEYN